MAPVTIAPADIAALLPAGARVLVTGASGESALIAEAITGAGEDLGPATFTGIFVPGVNRHTYLANAASKVETFFVTPELKTELGLLVTHRSEEHTSELQSLMRISYAVFCLKKKTSNNTTLTHNNKPYQEPP